MSLFFLLHFHLLNDTLINWGMVWSFAWAFKNFIVWLFYFVFFWSFDLKLFFILLSCQKYIKSKSLIKINWNFASSIECGEIEARTLKVNNFWIENSSHEFRYLHTICYHTHTYNKYEEKSRFSDSLHFHTFSLMFYIFISHSIAFSSYLPKLMFCSKISVVVFSLLALSLTTNRLLFQEN